MAAGDEVVAVVGVVAGAGASDTAFGVVVSLETVVAALVPADDVVLSWSSWFSACSKAARAAAWVGESAARMAPAPRARHKPTDMVVFIK